MAAVNWIVPSSRWHIAAGASYTNFAMTTAGHRLALVFTVKSSITPTDVLLRLGIKTGATPTYRVSIQALDGSGRPSGTDLCTPATFNPTGLSWADNTTRWIPVSGASALSPGTYYALVVTYDSGTIGASNNASFTAINTSLRPDNWTTPYYMTDANVGTWTPVGNTSPVFGAVRSATATHGAMLASAIVNASISGAGQRLAQKFSFPSGAGQSCDVAGIAIQSMVMPAAGSVTLGIWRGDGTAVSTVTLDTDHAGNTVANRAVYATFPTVATLNTGVTYYAGVERVGTIDPAPRYFDHVDARDLEAYVFGAGACVATWNGSAWTDVDTGVLPLSLFLADWTVASGSGNGISYARLINAGGA